MAETTISLSDSLIDELSDVSLELERIDDLAAGVAKSLTSGLRSAILEGKSFNSILSDIALSLADIALKAALEPLGTLTSSLVTSLFAGTDTALAGVTAFAKGGVVASPTYFPLAQGLGVAGEAGAEAVLPLQRTSDGRLGVASNASRPISVSVNVQATDARSFVGAEAEMSAMLLRAVRRGTRAS